MAHPVVARALATVAVTLAGWIAAKALHLKPPMTRPSPNGTHVNQAIDATGLLTQALTDVLTEGVNPTFGVAVIGKFMGQVPGELSHHRAAKLCLWMVEEGITATEAALWSSRDAARLLIALQRELDTDGGIASPYLQKVIAMVWEGKTVSEILTKHGRLSVPRSPPF